MCNDAQGQGNSASSEKRLMRWAFLTLIALWLIAAMIVPVVVFSSTQDPRSLYLFSMLAPPVGLLVLIAKYLFREDRDYELAALKIWYKAVMKHGTKLLSNGFQPEPPSPSNNTLLARIASPKQHRKTETTKEEIHI